MEKMTDYLLKRIQFLKTIRAKIISKYDGASDGKLRITNRKGVDQYYFRSTTAERNGKYLRKAEVSRAYEIAQKEYNAEVIDAIDNEIASIELFLENYPSNKAEDIYPKMSERRKKIVTPAIEPVDAFREKWEKEEYNELPFDNDVAGFYTERGERVRSKSEIIIANLLYNDGVPYKYEHPLHLPGLGTIHPDFTILDLESRKEIYWEHFGIMDNLDYSRSAIKKIMCYEANGYLLGRELIITMETVDKPLDIRLVKSKIRRLKELDLCA